MRWIIYGMGAIGGTVAGLLARAGHETLGISRGAQLEAVRAHGLRLRCPDMDEQIPVPVVSQPSEVTFRPDDAVLMAMKTQDSWPALLALREAGAATQPIFCLQNGVANEPMAARLFPHVHGVTVMMPATYLAAGEVVCHGAPKHGIFDLGRFPHGLDAADTAFAEALDASGIAAFPTDTVMASKYGKLVMNLGNIVNAALGPDVSDKDLVDALRAEAAEVLKAARIKWRDVGVEDTRRDPLMRVGHVPGAARVGGSTAQSLLRGANTLETDWLNGEIAYLARLSGVEAPLNARAQALAQHLVLQGMAPGDMTAATLRSALGFPAAA